MNFYTFAVFIFIVFALFVLILVVLALTVLVFTVLAFAVRSFVVLDSVVLGLVIFDLIIILFALIVFDLVLFSLSSSIPSPFSLSKMRHVLDERENWEVRRYFGLSYSAFRFASGGHTDVVCLVCSQKVKSAYKQMKLHMKDHGTQVSTLQSHFDIKKIRGSLSSKSYRYSSIK